MAFVNLQIDLTDLPQADELVMEPMAPSYEREVKTQQLIIWSPIVLVSLLPWLFTQFIWLLAIPMFVLILAGIISTLLIKKALVKGIAMRDFDIAYRSGLFWRKTVIVAYNRVQHVEVSSGPLQRKFDLASAKLFTAGGTSVDLKIDGLSTERAEQIRAFLSDKIEETKSE
ncbi:MAG: PH domain-containing protein [Lysobacterales bacterium]